MEKDLSDVSLGPNPMPELAHIVLGVESGSHQHDDFVALCVLSMVSIIMSNDNTELIILIILLL